MTFQFERRTGAPADVTELDYVSALHQTDVKGGIRKDGSIQDVDISLFLSSRYGIQATPQDVREKILSGIGSTDGYMDMMQLVSLLLIPTLREQQEGRSPDDDLLTYTLEMMLHDVTGSRAPKPLTKTLVKQILQAYGEEALAEDDELVEEMLEQAGKQSRQDRAGLLLNTETFCRALTHDVQQFDIDNKNKISTSFDDVFGNGTPPQSAEEEQEQTEPTQDVSRFKHYKTITPTAFKRETKIDDISLKYTAAQIDNAADTFRSKALVVFQWSFFVLSFQTYLFNYVTTDFLNLREKCPNYNFNQWGDNVDAFFCTVAVSIVKWLVIMLTMSVCGLCYFWLAGIGNFVECKNPILPFIGMSFSFVSTFLPWWFIGKDTSFNDNEAQEFLEVVTYLLGGCTIVVSVWQFISILIPEVCCSWDVWEWFRLPGEIRTATRIKQAAATKVDNMVRNALEMQRVKKQESVVPTHFGQALLNFAETTPDSERVGGFCWTWRMIWSRDLFRREGLLFSGRLLSTNFTQFALGPFILIGGSVAAWLVEEELDEKVKEAEDFLNDNMNGMNVTIAELTQSTERAITTSIAMATAVAFITSIAIALMVLPSTTTLTLQFRSGVLPFVDDPLVKLLRIAPDQTAYLKGFMFWGALLASILLGGIVGFLVFVFLWPPTVATAQWVLSIIVGSLIVLAVHVMFAILFRQVTSKAFYRSRPAAANMIVLIREAGLVALTQGFVAIRILKLLFTMILYIGRVDAPFLYQSCAQVGGFRIDREPYMFQIDILQHEAHRHPFIESLGTMYLLNLRYDDFCSHAGSTWRLIFVYVLMPWLSKYRAMRRPQPKLELDIEEGTTDDANMPSATPPLRAVTLVDPQAYSLRAVSLIPVASGAVFRSSTALGKPPRKHSLIDDDSDDEKDEEIRKLNAEVLRLKMQLRLHEWNPPPATFCTPKRSPLFDTALPKPGWEDDYEDESLVITPHIQPHEVKGDDMVGRRSPDLAARAHHDDAPLHSAIKRKKSKGPANHRNSHCAHLSIRPKL